MLDKLLTALFTFILKNNFYEKWKLNKLPLQSVEAGNLPAYNAEQLAQLLRNLNLNEEFKAVKQQLESMKATGVGEGVNPGDQRALYTLARAMQVEKILEIGTHVGGSTVPLAMALLKNLEHKTASKGALTTVDIRDVNDETTKPWLKFGATSSPLHLIRQLKADSLVRFVVQDSTRYLSGLHEQFDFIFIDGSHQSQVVYREIPLAVKALKPGGILLLHDYYPDNKPLWSKDVVIPGPYLAGERLKSENPAFDILPLGALPWQTKLNSCNTSLAMLVRRN